jgi:Cu+-exporting ATPase
MVPEDDLIRFAASAEMRSEHPLAKAIVSFAENKGIELIEPLDFMSAPGGGVRCKVDGKEVAVGNEEFTGVHSATGTSDGRTVVFVTIGGEYAGSIAISDTIRGSSASAVSSIIGMGMRPIMVTGDSEGTATAVAGTAGIAEFRAKALPEDKLNIIKDLQVAGENVAMAGDGINDAPALTQVDLGIAIGSGTDIAIEAADVVIMNDDVRSIPAAIEMGRATLKNVKQNLFFAFCYNAVCIPIAAGLPYLFGVGMMTEMPMLAAAAMSLSSISVVTNALRLRRAEPWSIGRK